jgi:hypothetical protein
MTSKVDNHKFNDDLLLTEKDRDYAIHHYSQIFHVLDHRQLQEFFLHYDNPANIAKRKSLLFGLSAIACGFAALAVAALELYPWDGMTEYCFAIFSGVCAIASFLIGSAGMLIASRKREWLQHRLMGERIRQFHFQTFVFRIHEIFASLRDHDAKLSFALARERWFESFKKRFDRKLDAALFAILQDEDGSEMKLHEGARRGNTIIETEGLNPLFEAYRELRILHQLRYADYKLHDDHKILSSMPARQFATLSLISLALITLLVAIHAGILMGVTVWPQHWHTSNIHVVAVLLIIWIALAALATRAIEEGLQPEREVERYRQYRAAVRTILERYNDASTQTQKLEIMVDMERAAFDEMRNFLIAFERSRFII